ncbi:MAG: hypothetical protein CL572_03780 [Alphaproteobacteria bacterium]|nr:hypothetical protein [Alphaproteobacteria bacterium]
MKKSLIFFLFFLLTCPSIGLSAWFKLFSSQTADLYLDTSSIKREDNSLFFSQLVNYKVKQSNGMLSLITFSEVNCRNLSIRDIKYFTYKNKMGKGKNFYSGKPKKNWKNTKKGTSVYFLNEVLCDRVLK